MASPFLFYGFALLITICSILVVTLKNPVTAAVTLVIELFLLAGVYAMQGAEFLAAIQVLVYAGAILVLFMFVIMLLNLEPKELLGHRFTSWDRFWLILIGAGFLGLMGKMLGVDSEFTTMATYTADNTYELGVTLFQKYLWPFELASILILLATVSTVVIVTKKKPGEGNG